MIPKINPKTVKPQQNWVLIKPSEDIFRINAKAASGMSVDTTWTPWMHPVIFGTVVAFPEKLTYIPFEEMKQICRDNHDILSDPLSYKVELDIKAGDEVYFNYIAADNAIKMSRLIVWDNQIYMFVRYDLLLCRMRKGKFTSLNGWIYYDKIETEIRNEHAEGSVVYNEQQQRLDIGTKTYRRQTGKITSLSYVEEYFWHSKPGARDYFEPAHLLTEGDVIMFDFKSDLKLENDITKVSDIGWRRVHEKDVMGYYKLGEFIPYPGRILVKPDANTTDKNGLIVPENFRKPTTEGVVVKKSTVPSNTWFDEIKPGARIKFNVNDPKLLVGVGDENYIVLRPQNIIYFND